MSVVDLHENIVCYVTAHAAISLRFDDSDSEASEIDSDNEFDDSPDEEWIPDAENVYRRPLIDSGKSVLLHSQNEIMIHLITSKIMMLLFLLPVI